MDKKTNTELRALWRIFQDGADYEAFPDGASWNDLRDAQELTREECIDA